MTEREWTTLIDPKVLAQLRNSLHDYGVEVTQAQLQHLIEAGVEIAGVLATHSSCISLRDDLDLKVDVDRQEVSIISYGD